MAGNLEKQASDRLKMSSVESLEILAIRVHRTDRVAWSVCLSVCLSVTIVNPAKTTEPIEMPSGVWTYLGPRKHVLDKGTRWCHLVSTIESSSGREWICT